MNYIIGTILILFLISIARGIYFHKKYKPGTGRKEIVAVHEIDGPKLAIKRALANIGQQKNCKFARTKFLKSYNTGNCIIYHLYEIEYWLKQEPEKVSGMYDMYGSGGFPM